MTQQNPAPRHAVAVGFGVPMNSTILAALGLLLIDAVEASGRWDAEDSIYAFRDHAATDREAWVALETALATRADPEAALELAEGLANGAPQGQPPNPTNGTEAQVLAIWGAHALTAPARRARVRALSRVVADRTSPAAVLAALAAAVDALPAA